MNYHNLLVVSVAVLMFSLVGCESCGNPPPAAVADPHDFIGTWQLTIEGRTAPVTLILRRAANQTSPGELSLDGSWGGNVRVSGSATGHVFAGTAVYGNSAYGIDMRIVTDGQAAGTFTSAMTPNNFIGARMGPE